MSGGFIFGGVVGLFFRDDDFFDDVTLTDGVDDFQSLVYFTEAGVVAIQMSGVAPVVADEELGASGVSTRVGHGEYSSVVTLVAPGELAFYGVARSARAIALGAAALYDEIRYYPMEGESVVETGFGKLDEVSDRVGSILLVKKDFHDSFSGVYFCFVHVICINVYAAKVKEKRPGMPDVKNIGTFFLKHLIV